MASWAAIANVIAAFALLSSPAAAQELVHKHFSTGVRSIEQEAAERSIDIPQLSAGGDGTLVVPHYSHHRILIDIIGSRADSDNLLLIAKRVADHLELPNADFTAYAGQTISAVRIDLSDYVQTGRQRRFELSLNLLARSLEGATAPIWIAVAPGQSAEVKLGNRVIDDWTFLSLHRLGRERLTFSSEVPWYSELVIGIVLLLMVGSGISVSRAIVVGDRTQTIDPQNVADPDSVQEGYEKSRHQIWFGCAFVAFLIVGGFLLVSALPSSLNAISNINWLIFPMVICFGSIPVALLIRWLRGSKGPSSPSSRKLVLGMASMAWIALSMLASIALMFLAPDALSTYRREMLVMTVTAPMLAVATFILGTIYLNRKYNIPLPADHALRKYAESVAKENGTRIRDIYTTDIPGANALMTVTGRLALSDDLMSNLDEDELRAVVAHEIGHQRHRDVIKLLAASLTLFLLVSLGYQWLVTRYASGKESLRFLFVLAPMSAIIPYVLLGKRRRQAELEADKFAVKATGDPELVIRALMKLNHLNESPYRLTKFDESLSTHPSLESRIAAIRAMSQTT